MNETLNKGEKYDLSKMIEKFAGWNTTDTDLAGYNVWDYFDFDGTYLGPDVDGIEPVFEFERR
ncbi:MAG: hypothetical protein HXY23_14355 [Parvularculaceae bacterium]|nr:hypothetical protein [Parvularculaceae bacterium]